MKINNTSEMKASKFSINSSYQEFTDRQKNVFDQLNTIERDTMHLLSSNETFMNTLKPKSIDAKNNAVILQHSSQLKPEQLKDDIFKKPEARPPRSISSSRKPPDYQINPHKWTRYSLDIPSEHMSEKANTAAALSFLKDIEDRKNQNEQNTNELCMPQKVCFKEVPTNQLPNTEMSKATVCNSKVVMAEYVVGQKIKKKLKKREKKLGGNSTIKEIKLDHLTEHDEDE